MNIDILDLDIYIKTCAERGVELQIGFHKVGCSLRMWRMKGEKRIEHSTILPWTELRHAWPNLIEHHVNRMLEGVLTFDPAVLSHGAPHYTVPPSAVEDKSHG